MISRELRPTESLNTRNLGTLESQLSQTKAITVAWVGIAGIKPGTRADI